MDRTVFQSRVRAFSGITMVLIPRWKRQAGGDIPVACACPAQAGAWLSHFRRRRTKTFLICFLQDMRNGTLPKASRYSAYSASRRCLTCVRRFWSIPCPLRYSSPCSIACRNSSWVVYQVMPVHLAYRVFLPSLSCRRIVPPLRGYAGGGFIPRTAVSASHCPRRL